MSSLNDEIFRRLENSPLLADAVNDFTRTKLREQAFCRRIFTNPFVADRSFWLTLGVPEDQLDPLRPLDEPGYAVAEYTWAFDPGRPFNEVAASRAAREDFERRLARRQVTRREWRRHVERLRPERYARAGVADLAREEVFYAVMGALVRAVLELHDAAAPGIVALPR